MKQKDSAILKLLNGLEQDELEILSDEYYKALKVYKQKNYEFESKIKKYPNLIKLHREVLDAIQHENVIYADDMYKHAFSIGLAVGQEVFGKKSD